MSAVLPCRFGQCVDELALGVGQERVPHIEYKDNAMFVTNVAGFVLESVVEDDDFARVPLSLFESDSDAAVVGDDQWYVCNPSCVGLAVMRRYVSFWCECGEQNVRAYATDVGHGYVGQCFGCLVAATKNFSRYCFPYFRINVAHWRQQFSDLLL